MRVIVTGTIGYDFIMNFSGRFADRIMPDKIHKISLAPLVDKLSKQFGGTAANIAYNLKLLGLNPFIISAAGNDFDAYEAFFKKHDIATSGIKIYPKEYTGMYFVVTDHDDNQIGAFHMGATKYAKDLTLLKGDLLQNLVTATATANSHPQLYSIRSMVTDDKDSGNSLNSRNQKSDIFVILAPTQKDAMVKYVHECRDHNLPYLFDPAFQIGDFSPEDLRFGIEGASILIGNDYEISLIESRLGISHEELLLMTPILVTTLASKGSVIETRKEAIHIKPAKPKNVSDPTGAGDAYRAGFIAGYLRFLGLKPDLEPQKRPEFTADELIICGQMGSVAAVYTVEKYGTVTHTYTKETFAKRFSENYGTSLNI